MARPIQNARAEKSQEQTMSTEVENGTSSPDAVPNKSGSKATKIIVLLAVVAAALFAYHNYGDALSLDYLASKEAELRQYRVDNPVLVYGVAMVIYVLVTGLSLPGALVLSLTYAWYFGFARGMLVVSFASTAGATLSFVLSRYFFRETIQHRFGDRLASVNDAFEREGAFYLFTLRMITAVPFVVINPLMALTPIRIWTFWWVSQLGMLPGTAVYVYAGSQFPDLETLAENGSSGILKPQLIGAFALLGLSPIIVKTIIGKWKASRTATAVEE
jgi:uncharacterized membrane protein YdjX (TVP38/TMEM64 family)